VVLLSVILQQQVLGFLFSLGQELLRGFQHVFLFLQVSLEQLGWDQQGRQEFLFLQQEQQQVFQLELLQQQVVLRVCLQLVW